MKAHDVVTRLARRSRVIILGGIAVVLHGLHRSTRDVDLWVDPLGDADLWADSLRGSSTICPRQATRTRRN